LAQIELKSIKDSEKIVIGKLDDTRRGLDACTERVVAVQLRLERGIEDVTDEIHATNERVKTTSESITVVREETRKQTSWVMWDLAPNITNIVENTARILFVPSSLKPIVCFNGNS
jgi:hypothetical protein